MWLMLCVSCEGCFCMNESVKSVVREMLGLNAIDAYWFCEEVVVD